jgi:hypothetical protein
MRVSVEVQDFDRGMRDLLERLKHGADHVDIGVLADEGEEMVKIAAANEYGAHIKHPGGTSYGYLTPEDANNGRVRFLPAGGGYITLGVTGPHDITIPMRSFIRSTMDANAQKYLEVAQRLMKKIIDRTMTRFQALALMGLRIQRDIQRTIDKTHTPPNAPSTIRRKGSSHPLIDTGNLRASIRYSVGLPDDSEGNDGGHAVQEKEAAA